MGSSSTTTKKGSASSSTVVVPSLLPGFIGSDWFRQWSPLIVVLGSLVVFFLLFFTVVLQVLPIADSNCLTPEGLDKCWCETIDHEGLIKQPWNTWSNLGFIFAGLGCLTVVCLKDRGQVRDPRKAVNPMTKGGFYPVCWGVILTWMGPCSMMFHGPMMHWGGFSDFVMVMAFAVFVALYNMSRLWRRMRPISTFASVFVTVVVLVAILYVMLPVRALIFYLFTIGSAVLLEMVTWLSWSNVTRDPTGAAIFLGLFAAALVIWELSKTGGPLCDPDGFQGHGVWHTLIAVAIPCFFWSLRSEVSKSAIERTLANEHYWGEVELAAGYDSDPANAPPLEVPQAADHLHHGHHHYQNGSQIVPLSPPPQAMRPPLAEVPSPAMITLMAQPAIPVDEQPQPEP